MAAEEMGIEVELIRLGECKMTPCTACVRCNCFMHGPAGCIHQDDDVVWLTNKYLDSDGFMLAAPVYSLGPINLVSVFRDRVFGPKTDMEIFKQSGHNPAWTRDRIIPKPGALISVGGALSEHWTSMGLASLYTTTFSAEIKVVDHMSVFGVADPGAATVAENYMAHAHKLGQNLAYAMLHPEEGYGWRGDPDEKWTCPECHTNLLFYKPDNSYAECAVCGARLDIKSGPLDFEINQEHIVESHIRPSGKKIHTDEIMYCMELTKKKQSEIDERYPKYKNYFSCIVKSPSRQKQKNT